MRLLITGGGTGGHVYPALSVIGALCEELEAIRREDMAWVGRADSLEERIVAQEGLAFCPIAAGAMRGVNPLGMVRNVAVLAQGVGQAGRLIDRFQPDAVLATGGYVSVPLVVAARTRKVPALIYLPDMEPGWAVRFLTFFAARIAVSFEAVAGYFPKRKVLVSGYPVRRALWQTERRTAREVLGLDPAVPMLLVLGGSSGAHSINEAVRRGLGALLATAQVIHISGPEDYPGLQAHRETLAEELRPRYHLFPYLYEQMTDALVAADLVVARAGAATLGEFPAAGLPAVLVPYPYAGQHQWINATYLAERGAAAVVADGDLQGRFLGVVQDLLGSPERLRAMSVAARALAVPNAALRIATELQALAQSR